MGLLEIFLGGAPAQESSGDAADGHRDVQLCSHAEDGIARYTPDQRHTPLFRMGHDPGVACRAFAAMTLWVLGYPEQALARLHEALALAHALSHPFSLAYAWCWAAIVSQFRRDVPAVYEQAEAAIALSTEQGFPPPARLRAGAGRVAASPG
jgi:predicted ATPase